MKPRPQPAAPASIPPAPAALALVALVLVAYFPALQGGFVWDDDAYVSRNPTLLDLGGLWRIWFDPGATPQYYPLTFTTFWLEAQLWGMRPFGFHLVNVLLHALNAVLVWRLLVRLAVPGAWLAAALFAVHPVHVESVAWITERKNVLSAALALTSALCFLRSFDAGGRRGYLLSLALFAAALASKTAVCFLPAALAVALWWKDGSVSRRQWAALAPFFAVGLAFAATTAWLERYHVGARGPQWSLGFVERSLSAGRALWFYAGKLVWPEPLMFNYPAWQLDAALPWQYLFPAAAVIAGAAAWALRARIGRGPAAAAAVFAGGLLPVLGFFDYYAMRYSYVADHFVYLPSVALLALVAAAFVGATRAGGGRGRWILGIAAAVLLLSIALTQRQSRAYRDIQSLWFDTLAKNPDSWLAHNNLGSWYFENGRYEEASAHWREAVRLDASRAEIHGNLGRDAMHRGRFDEAEKAFRRAVELGPESGAERMNLAVALSRQGRHAEAVREYEAALALEPGDAALHSDLGAALASLGRLDEAVREYRRALELDPDDAAAHNNLGLTLTAQGHREDAVVHFAEAIRLAPAMAEAHNNYAIVLENLGRPGEAVAQYEEVVRLAPDSAEAHYNLAGALAKAGRRDEAAQHYGEALRLRPDLLRQTQR